MNKGGNILFGLKRKETYVAFMAGKVLPLEMVKDPVFSKKIMGDGFAIEPMNGEVVAPCDGEIVTVFPTGHAYGLREKNGREILIHLGIDTVELKGKGFKPFVTEGQKVKAGDRLAEMDLKLVKEAGKFTTSMLLFTTGEQVEVLKENQVVEIKEKAVIQVK